jgi:hypothetical protein
MPELFDDSDASDTEQLSAKKDQPVKAKAKPKKEAKKEPVAEPAVDPLASTQLRINKEFASLNHSCFFPSPHSPPSSFSFSFSPSHLLSIFPSTFFLFL